MKEHESYITYKISYIDRILKRHIDQDTLKFGLTAEQGRTVLYLNKHKDEVIHLKDLEKVFHLRKSSLTSLINNMEKNGIVRRTNEENDQRLKRIELTDLGYEKVNLLIQSFIDNEDKVRKTLSDEEVQQLNSLLDKVVDQVTKL